MGRGIHRGFITHEELNKSLNYPSQIKSNKVQEYFDKIVESAWEDPVTVHDQFVLTKKEQRIQDFQSDQVYDIIYFDAFGARVQPELWTVDIFQKMYNALQDNGVLVTYAAKGSVRRAMQEVGFTVERLPGPPGKREMLRATKINTI